jgi:ATP-dependent helicase/nuclease subunit A
MPLQRFTIYRSSAGSGKTRTLAREYLALALRFRAGYFRRILAVTFTNKATQEMKDRILQYLNDFVSVKHDSLAQELKEELKQDDQTFLQNCHELRTEILHHYSQFSISTIDAFFQKVIRAFTREAGLSGDYRLEVEQDTVLEEVINDLMDELGSNKELTKWMVEFATHNLESDKSWDIRHGLMNFSMEIFREEFKTIEEQLFDATDDRNYFTELRKKLWQQKKVFVNKVIEHASEAMRIIREHNLEATELSFGSNSGLITFFNMFLDNNLKEYKEPSPRIRNYFAEARNWPSKKNTSRPKDIIQLAEEKLIPLLKELITIYDASYSSALSTELVLNNFYAFGLLSDISRKLKEYKAANNLMLLSDAPKFLNGVIGKNDTPFIYEKVGSFYKNYLIDEFQDTSQMQWENFYPLVRESLDSGNKSLVVGDVKQAIYRWRGGNLKLLQQQIEQQIGPEQVELKELVSNYRSAEHIVAFNNALFKTAATQVAAETGNAMAANAYQDVQQQNIRPHEGFVQVEFIETDKELKWKEVAKGRVIQVLEQLQEAKVKLKDIAILVRRNDEGQQLVAHLLNHKNSTRASARYKYDVISNESLRIDGAASVNLLLSALRYLHNPDDDIARAELAYEFARIHKLDMPLADVFAVSNQTVFESTLPVEFRRREALKKLPLFELTETLIRIFNLGSQTGELAYLQAFQDLVLNFYTRERNDLQAFLEWWEENKDTDKTSLKTSGEINAAQIITIHKSKGLQFKYVIIPFCAWDLDHSKQREPNLWVKSDEGIFKNAGFLPVKYGSALKNTCFRAYYEQERAQCYLDNLNLLYVAFTRAELGLWVMASPRKNTVAGLVYDSIQQEESLIQHWNEAEQVLKLGMLSVLQEDGQHPNETIELKSYPTARWRDKLVIRQAGKLFFGEGSDQQERVKYGIHVHSLLSRIHYADEMDKAFDEVIGEGLLSTTDRHEVKQHLTELFNSPMIAPWFNRGWQVRTEVPILLPGGEENRIDRLLTKEQHAIVIDFKTGKPSKADQKQVMEYMEILRKMNFTKVEGFVLYIRTGEVMEVMAGKAKTVKKKDENQLNLEL